MPEKPIYGENGGLNLEEIRKISRVIDEPTLISIIADLKDSLINSNPNNAPLKIPQFAPPPEVEPMSYFANFLELIVQDEWLNENTLFILFDASDGDGKGRGFGLVLKSHSKFWKSPRAIDYLRTASITLYTPKQYLEMVISGLPS